MRRFGSVVSCALALAACGQTSREPPTGGGDLPYPRIASYRTGSFLDDDATAMLERVPLAVVDAEVGALDPEGLRAIRACNQRLELLAYVTSEAIARQENAGEQPLAVARFAKVPASAWVVEPGSTTVGATSDTATRIRVSDPSVFSVTRPPSQRYGADEPTYLLIGDEHVKLVVIEGDELVVERGFRSTPAMHPAGTRIAAHVVVFAGTWMLDITGAEWRDLLAEETAAMVDQGPWSGVFLDVCVEDIGMVGGGVDLDRDGAADDPAQASAAWQAGFGELVGTLRARLGDHVPIVANAGAQDCPHDALDGILLEGFPIGPSPDILAFQVGFDRYLRWTSRTSRRPLSIANAYSPKIGLGEIEPGQDEAARGLSGDAVRARDRAPG